jgi:hypothetical protein
MDDGDAPAMKPAAKTFDAFARVLARVLKSANEI